MLVVMYMYARHDVEYNENDYNVYGLETGLLSSSFIQK
jgi:hypothetical protein